MNIFIIIATLIFLIFFIVLVVVLIITLIQIKNAAKQIEEVFKKINQNIENFTNVSSKITSGINTFLPFIASLTAVGISTLTNFLKNLFFGRKKSL